ncbi:MAG: hypothetical protein WD740_00790 [Anaerolineales bacterium]
MPQPILTTSLEQSVATPRPTVPILSTIVAVVFHGDWPVRMHARQNPMVDDCLVSTGDRTAVVQADDYRRSSIIGKVVATRTSKPTRTARSLYPARSEADR